MTKDAMMLMHKLMNDKSLKDTDIYHLYTKTITIKDDILKLIDLINKLDDIIYDFEFLTTTGKELGVKRSAINELIQGMCEEVGKNIEHTLKDQPIIIDRYPDCPIKSNKILLSSIPNEEYAEIELKKSDFSNFKLGEYKKDNRDWYSVYVFELVE